MKKRKKPKPKFQVGDKVHCMTIDLYGQRLTVKSSRYINFLGYYVYTLEDEKGQQIHRGNKVSIEVPEHFLQSAEGVLEKFIRMQSFSLGVIRISKELLELIHRTRVSKYSISDPKDVLLRIIEEIKMKTGHYGFRSWELMVEHMAKWLVLNKKTGLACMAPLQGFKGLDLKKDSLFEFLEGLDYFNHYYTAAKANPWDYIGEVYTELGCVGLGQNMTPRAIVEFMTKAVYPEKKLDGADEWFCYNSYLEYLLWYWLTYHSRPSHLKTMDLPFKTQLDPCVGTGRFLLVATQMKQKENLVLFGIEINPSLYRACLVNMAMFSNHPYSIVCGDTLRIDQKYCGPSSPLWDLGNRWNPPDISVFYWKPSPITPETFSLKHFTEENKEVTATTPEEETTESEEEESEEGEEGEEEE